MTDKTILDRLQTEMAQEGDFSEREARVPTVPAPGPSLESVMASVRAIKTVVDTQAGAAGSVLDKSLTLRDLINMEAIQLTIGNKVLGGTGDNATIVFPTPPVVIPPSAEVYVDPRPKLGTPPTPTSVTVNGAIQSIFVSWQLAVYYNHSHVEVWRAATNNLGSATMIGVSTGSMYTDLTGVMGQTYYYWVRAVGFNVDTGAPITGAYNAGAGSGTPGGRAQIGNVDLGPLIVEATNIAAGAVTGVKISDASLTATKFASTIEPVTLVPSAPFPTVKSTNTIYYVPDKKLYRWSGTAYIAEVPFTDVTGVTITDTHIAAGAISGTKITAGTLDADRIVANSITSGQIAAGAIKTDELDALAVTAGKIAAGAIVAGKIASDAIVANNIVAGSITGDRLQAGTITANEIAGNTITAAKIATGTITANEIAASTITGNKIAANTITAGHMSVSSLSAISANMGAVTSGDFQMGSSGTGWSLLRRQGRWWYENNDGIWIGTNSSTSHCGFEFKAGPCVMRMWSGTDFGAAYGFQIETPNFGVDSSGNVRVAGVLSAGSIVTAAVSRTHLAAEAATKMTCNQYTGDTYNWFYFNDTWMQVNAREMSFTVPEGGNTLIMAAADRAGSDGQYALRINGWTVLVTGFDEAQATMQYAVWLNAGTHRVALHRLSGTFSFGLIVLTAFTSMR